MCKKPLSWNGRSFLWSEHDYQWTEKLIQMSSPIPLLSQLVWISHWWSITLTSKKPMLLIVEWSFHGQDIFQYNMAETYLGSFQSSKIALFAEIFLQNTPSYIFNRVLNSFCVLLITLKYCSVSHALGLCVNC